MNEIKKYSVITLHNLINSYRFDHLRLTDKEKCAIEIAEAILYKQLKEQTNE